MCEDCAARKARGNELVEQARNIERGLVWQEPDATIEARIQRILERRDDFRMTVAEIVHAAAACAVDERAASTQVEELGTLSPTQDELQAIATIASDGRSMRKRRELIKDAAAGRHERLASFSANVITSCHNLQLSQLGHPLAVSNSHVLTKH